MPSPVSVSPEFQNPEFYVDPSGAIRPEPFAQVSQIAWAVPGQDSFAEVWGQENLYPFRPQYLQVGDTSAIRALVFQDQALARQIFQRLGSEASWQEGYQLVLFSQQGDPSFTGYALAPMASGASLAFTGQVYLLSGRINGALDPLYQGLATLLGMERLAVELGLPTAAAPIPAPARPANEAELTERIERAYQALNHPAADQGAQVVQVIFLLEALAELGFSAYYQNYSANPPALYFGVLRRLPAEVLPHFVELFDLMDDIWEHRIRLPYPDLTPGENIDRVWRETLSAMRADDDFIILLATEEGLDALQYLQQELEGPPVDSGEPHPIMDEYGENPLPRRSAPDRSFNLGRPDLARATAAPGDMPPLQTGQNAFSREVIDALIEGKIPARLWSAIHEHIGENPFATPELFNRMDALLRERGVPGSTLDGLRSLAESSGLLERTDRTPGGEGRGK